MNNFANGRNAYFWNLPTPLGETSHAEGTIDQLVAESACTVPVVLRDIRNKNSKVV
jgi:hypothetical protein